MALDELKILNKILKRVGRLAFLRVDIPSRTLAAAVKLLINLQGGEAILEIPHYWAVYYHDGFGPINSAPGKFLVWFPYPFDDPRFTNGWPPERANEVRRLTKEEFSDFLSENRRRKLQGSPPIMIVARVTKARPARPFFGSLNAEIKDGVELIIDDEMSTVFQQFVKETPEPKPITIYL